MGVGPSCREQPGACLVGAGVEARAAAEEQEIPGDTETTEYEDDKGKWHTETASGQDRPHTVVKDKD